MQRTGGLFFFGIFAIAGLAIGGMSIRSLGLWFGSLDWPSVPATAEVLRVDSNHSGNETSYRLECRYRYRFGAQQFVSERVSFFEIGTNSDSYPRALHRRLSALNDVGRMTCFVNPTDPSQAVLDRTVRSGLMGMTLLFLITHGSVGVAGLGYLSAARPPRKIDGQIHIVSDHAGWRRSAAWLIWLHCIAFLTASLIAILGMMAGQWEAIVPLVMAILAATAIWFCARYTRKKHPWAGQLILPETIQDESKLRLRMPRSAKDPIELEARWSLPAADKLHQGVAPIEGPAVSIDSKSFDHGTITFASPVMPSPSDDELDAIPRNRCMEFVGMIGNRGYRDTFTVPASITIGKPEQPA
ncbi:hypothetical protein K227x_17710 [Rubripirellula lacrimiformis]|uniref:DUF3592 domain-containing protein n=1 Tax=Rubripirellula lacrimiformis TaxID=1930273 RepID=A0A517N8C3_9BACT|nr:DUF3592 domain-containing protein [Rubripirellula lacrimiformis]QDT03389.1 hypothetical protein K227x_17710 [Rubripirellula lacrimiformis]